MTAVMITGLTMARGQAPRRGEMLLGYFDCELPSVELRSCSLWLFRNGKLCARGPMVDNKRRITAAVITDPQTYAAMCEAAGAAFLALGGTIEWPARSNGEGDA